MFCWHKWSEWKEFKVTHRYMLNRVNVPDVIERRVLIFQKRECQKCGKTQCKKVS